MEFLSKESINSKDLLKQINYFREVEYKEREANGTLTEAQKKRGHYIELRHDNLLRTIRDEFNIQDNLLNFEEVKNKIIPTSVEGIFETTYKDEKGEFRTMFILTIDQAKQVLMRESKVVRKAVIQYLNLLEKRIRELERKKGKITRKQETDSIKMLMEYGNVPEEKQRLYYMTYSKLPFIVLGMKKVSRDTLPADDLNLIKELESIIQVTILTSIIKGLDVKAIYQECKKVCINSLEDTEQKLIS
ncbi:Uncharacterised protein [Fusobacterium polymorphum]|uniref:Rha family transcriptional regulator n=1 Tax=Fusobacterium polymorphum ATCC 10953 TaxID=393480 RepID=A5TWC8_FUSNP|nr:hypothetical protein [Fusobacterium polymorphum]EDK89203.1 hypothetical protein FNP_1421 [Fusobacterium polymorphum ATCC 10953]UTI52241.1 Rha family transcriptional regulator [Fusobacterium polymorphum]WRL68975.1 hypothetical protein VKN78_02520 [Fusobacterium polymorphum]CKG99413.1 Uncharacterised protein [Fusobacterium polymorphum]